MLGLKQEQCHSSKRYKVQVAERLLSKRFELKKLLQTSVPAGGSSRSPVAKDRTVCFTAKPVRTKTAADGERLGTWAV